MHNILDVKSSPHCQQRPCLLDHDTNRNVWERCFHAGMQRKTMSGTTSLPIGQPILCVLCSWEVMQCSSAMDILFLMDGSYSIGKGTFERSKHYAVKLCEGLDVAPDKVWFPSTLYFYILSINTHFSLVGWIVPGPVSCLNASNQPFCRNIHFEILARFRLHFLSGSMQVRVGLIQFGTVPRFEFTLDSYSTKQELKKHIKKISYRFVNVNQELKKVKSAHYVKSYSQE